MITKQVNKEDVKKYGKENDKAYLSQKVSVERWKLAAWFAVGFITRAVFGG